MNDNVIINEEGRQVRRQALKSDSSQDLLKRPALELGEIVNRPTGVENNNNPCFNPNTSQGQQTSLGRPLKHRPYPFSDRLMDKLRYLLCCPLPTSRSQEIIFHPAYSNSNAPQADLIRIHVDVDAFGRQVVLFDDQYHQKSPVQKNHRRDWNQLGQGEEEADEPILQVPMENLLASTSAAISTSLSRRQSLVMSQQQQPQTSTLSLPRRPSHLQTSNDSNPISSHQQPAKLIVAGHEVELGDDDRQTMDDLITVLYTFRQAIRHVPLPMGRRFKFRALLGWGGNGFVAEAIDLHAQNGGTGVERVAVKFLPRENYTEGDLVRDVTASHASNNHNDTAQRSIPMEIWILKSVQHEHIVKFIADYDDANYFYLVMERVGTFNSTAFTASSASLNRSHTQHQAQQHPQHRPSASVSESRRPSTFSQSSSSAQQQQPQNRPSISETSSTSLPHAAHQPDLATLPTTNPHPIRGSQDAMTIASNLTELTMKRPTRADSGSLYHFIQTNTWEIQQPNVYRGIFKQLVNAYGALRRRGVCYLDFKCENILVSRTSKMGDGMKQSKRAEIGQGVSAWFKGRMEQFKKTRASKSNSSHAADPILESVKAASTQGDPPIRDQKTPEVKIKLIDFGMARLCQPGTKLNRYGTVWMSAPETLHGEGYDGVQGDIWALGLILYSMVTGGREAFISEEEVLSLLQRREGGADEGWIVMKEVDFPSHIDESVRFILRRILCPDPSRRATLPEITSMIMEW